jgi:phosphoglycolate phosphatase-like HAD superfamily hydrolase
MPKRYQLNIPWTPASRAAQIEQTWAKIAERLGKERTELARQVIYEFMSCYLSADELQKVGLPELVEGVPLTALALRQRGIHVGVSQNDVTKVLQIEQRLGRKLTAKELERFLGGKLES